MFFLLYKYTNSLEILESIMDEYYTLFPKIIKLNYFNRIKIIISYTYFKIIKKEIIDLYIQIFLIFLLKNAHNALINIINKMNEKSSFFIVLQEMNSLIQYDYSNKLGMTSKYLKEEFEIFTGNVIGVLLAKYRIFKLKSLHKILAMGIKQRIKTFMITSLIDKIAERKA